MKTLLLALILCLSLTGCMAYYLPYGDPPIAYYTGTIEFCDDFGCRYVTAPYYYDHGELIYWDVHFNCWIGPRGYLVGSVWHPGYHPEYRIWYHRGWYHGPRVEYRHEWREHHEFHGGHHR